MPIAKAHRFTKTKILPASSIKMPLIFFAFLGALSTYPKASPIEVIGSNHSQIVISNAQEFLAIENDLEAAYTLANNIDLNGQYLKPFGIPSNESFKGVFDGNGYKVSNFVLRNHESDIGLF